MKRGFRLRMTDVHRWGGLVAGWIGFAIFLTGSLAVFDDEFTRWASPELAITRPASRAEVLNAMATLESRSPDYWFAAVPTDRTPNMRAMWKNPAGKIERGEIDVASGAKREAPPAAGKFFTEFHYTLHGGKIGTWVVAAVSVAMLLAMVTGLIIHRRIFSDFFTFRPRASAQRAWLDYHNLIAVLSLPFLLMIVYTGLSIKSQVYLKVPNGPGKVTRAAPLAKPPLKHGAPLNLTQIFARAEGVLGVGRVAFVTVTKSGRDHRFVATRTFDDRLNLSSDTATFDRASGALLGTTRVDKPAYLTQRVFAGLHFGQFGGLPVRAIYFMLGMLGATMIAAGLVLFSIKRSNRLIAALSVTAVTGLTLACLTHLGASRWPDAVEAAPFKLFCSALAACAIHASVRPANRAWREQAWVGVIAGSCLAIGDLTNGLLAMGAIDPVRWWIDAGLLIFSLCLAATGWGLGHMQIPGPTRRRSTQAVAA